MFLNSTLSSSLLELLVEFFLRGRALLLGVLLKSTQLACVRLVATRTLVPELHAACRLLYLFTRPANLDPTNPGTQFSNRSAPRLVLVLLSGPLSFGLPIADLDFMPLELDVMFGALNVGILTVALLLDSAEMG